MKLYLIVLVALAGCASMPENNCPISSYAALWACQRPVVAEQVAGWRPATSRRAQELLRRGDLLAKQVKSHELSDAAAQQRLLDYTDTLEAQRLLRHQAIGAVQPQTVRIVP